MILLFRLFRRRGGIGYDPSFGALPHLKKAIPQLL